MTETLKNAAALANMEQQLACLASTFRTGGFGSSDLLETVDDMNAENR